MEVNTRLGWECPSEYLVYDANTYLGHAASRHFYKTNDGYAFAFFSINAAGWRGPVVVSTVPENVESYYEGQILYQGFSFQHLRQTWYVCNLHHMNTADYDTGVLIPIETTAINVNEWKTEIRNIMDMVGVKPYVSWKGISFIAGLAAGLATRAWAYMGEITMGLISKFITRNGTYNAAAEGADGFSSVVVDVPNTYSIADEGKAVENGSLVSQSAITVTATGTYTTTYNNSVVVDIPVANGEVF